MTDEIKEKKAIPDEILEKIITTLEGSDLSPEEQGLAVNFLVRPPDPDYIPREKERIPFRPSAFVDPDEYIVELKGKEPIQLDELNVEQLEFLAEYAMQGIVYVFQRPADEVAAQFSVQDILSKVILFAKSDGNRSMFKKKLDEVLAKMLSTDEQVITAQDLKKGRAREYFQAIQKLVGINTNFFDYISYVAPEDLIAVISILLGKLTSIKGELKHVLKEVRLNLSETPSLPPEPQKESPSQSSENTSKDSSDGGISTGSKSASSAPSKKKTRKKASVS